MDTSPYAIVADNLTRKFGDFVAVDHISFRIRKGEIFGLLGPNGAGKSTTIRMLCGLLTPTEGTAYVGGYDIRTQAEQVKHIIGYMSQRFSLYEQLTVQENMTFFGRAYRIPQKRLHTRIEEVLHLLDLHPLAHRITATLAAGWKQRVALACAILHEPEIVFLDEPTAGVDPVARRQFWDLIHSLAEAGTTICVTTHYLDEAEYCEHLVLIYQGRVIAYDSPTHLKKQLPAILLEVITPTPLQVIKWLQQQPEIIEASLFGTRIHVGVSARDKEEAIRKVRSMLQRRGFTIKHIRPVLPSLEDVFIYLIEHQRISSDS